tara:strand:- start:68 stop:508 length:441 start_codon:yes stop_codon:yes gene_type:complete
MQKAILACGCFWGPEEKFRKIKGITTTEVGYCGGNNSNVSYEEVCKGNTGHAEVVKLVFDENIISYENIIESFFKFHDATQINRQGPNIGTNYRSEIFYLSDEQKNIAEKILNRQNKKIATKISKEKNYCKAEEYHQKYIQKKELR